MDSLPPSLRLSLSLPLPPRHSVIFRVGDDGSRMLSRAQPSADLLSSAAAGNVIHSHWIGHLGMILGVFLVQAFSQRGAYLSMSWRLEKTRTTGLYWMASTSSIVEHHSL